MGGLSERTTRILQGGLPLPVIFHSLIGFMLGNGRSARESVLAGLIRDELGDLHGNRVLTYWGSWEDLVADLMEELEERELVTRAGNTWTLTGRVEEGVRVRVFHEVRITPYSPATLARRENLAYARVRAASYRSFLEGKGLFEGAIRDSFQRHWDSLAWDGDPEGDLAEETPEKKAPKRKKGEISQFALEYAKSEYPRWVTAREAAAAFSEWYPDRPPIRSSSAWNRLQLLVWKGQAEREDGKPDGAGPGRHPTLFRFLPEPEV